ncbi:hypothetical protein [Photobacterium kishitanii]|uniref:Bacteriocin n=1 Tax=Photobacterium kishitanii TaxID=318456 RepID=A0A2T3KJ51_9GAMM|nr:hypothetical protein [Photobacterium kishitanii]PSU99322.1 hypothetical protein C9J27_10200 [Photobacterium kishitanii]
MSKNKKKSTGSNLTGAVYISRHGDETKIRVEPSKKGALKGAAAGAALGSAVPVIGTAAGAAIGGVIGLIFG